LKKKPLNPAAFSRNPEVAKSVQGRIIQFMQDASIQANPRGNLKVFRVGVEQTPAIVIDDFALDTDEVIDYACQSNGYEPDSTSAYPGLRARLPRGYVLAVLNSIFRLLFKVYSVPSRLDMKPVNSVFSLVTTPEAELIPPQRVPHYDSTSPHYLAVLHYLNPGVFGNTGLFRHRPTGFENILQSRFDEYIQSREQFYELHGVPPAEYVKGSTNQFELYHEIGYRPNRLVAYPGTLLHSILVDPARDVDPDPRTGRLTANIFVDFS